MKRCGIKADSMKNGIKIRQQNYYSIKTMSSLMTAPIQSKAIYILMLKRIRLHTLNLAVQITKDSMMTHWLIIFGEQANVKATLIGQLLLFNDLATLYGAICIEMIRIKLKTRFT